MTSVEVATADMEALRLLCLVGIAAAGFLWWIMERLAASPPEQRGKRPEPICPLHRVPRDRCDSQHDPSP